VPIEVIGACAGLSQNAPPFHPPDAAAAAVDPGPLRLRPRRRKPPQPAQETPAPKRTPRIRN
jgi:hypothetical protein